MEKRTIALQLGRWISKTGFVIAVLLCFSVTLVAQDKKVTVSGHVKDKSNGEELINATVRLKGTSIGINTNAYGYFSLNVEKGKYVLICSFLGYKSIEIDLNLTASQVIDVVLEPDAKLLDEVVVTGRPRNDNVSNKTMSMERMSSNTIKQIPALMGEVDAIKAIQLLPGVQATSEGSSGFSVRGGTVDQNLILLDEATVYNASHMMGFFSVFNNDAVKDVTLYKGDIPAAYGGRLSSLLDVRTKDGNSKKFSGSGGIGTISSRLTLEGPIIKDRTTFVVSGRRTYADLFLKLSGDDQLKDSKLYFYDFNAKVSHRFNANNRIYAAAYLGQDNFGFNAGEFGYSNKTFTLRWNHLFSPKLFMNVTTLISDYDYKIQSSFSDALSVKLLSNLVDYSGKADFTWYANPNNTIRFGVTSTYHRISPGKTVPLGNESIFNPDKMPLSNAIESAVYLSNEQKLSDKLSLKYGIRYTLFQNIGKGTVYNFDGDFEKIDSTVYRKGDIFNTYGNWEPRVGGVYEFNSRSSVKASYSRTVQYIQLASNSASGSPLDVWFPASPNVKPQKADLLALGYFRNFRDNTIETSVEAYYKKFSNVVDFKDHAVLVGNSELEGELRSGKGKSYGLEFMVRKTEGRFTGWLSYTYSRSFRTINTVNDNKQYRAPSDKPHNISIVASYEASKRVTISANWVYASGTPVTYPVGHYWIDGSFVPIYGDRNTYRYPDYHRLDLSLTWKGKEKPGRKWHGEWNFSLYNAYGRKNVWTIAFTQDSDNPLRTKTERIYLFTFVPSVTYNFKF